MKRLILITLLAVNVLVLSDCCHADEEGKSEQGVCTSKVSHSNHNEMRVGAPPAEMELDPFYKKFLDCDGITVIGSVSQAMLLFPAPSIIFTPNL